MTGVVSVVGSDGSRWSDTLCSCWSGRSWGVHVLGGATSRKTKTPRQTPASDRGANLPQVYAQEGIVGTIPTLRPLESMAILPQLVFNWFHPHGYHYILWYGTA